MSAPISEQSKASVGAPSEPAQLGVKKHSHGDVVPPEGSRADRLTSYDPADFAELTGREEDWRFTPLDRLQGLHTGNLTGKGVEVSVDTKGIAGVTVETVSREDSRIGAAGIPADRVAALAWSSFQDATVVTIGKEIEVPGELEITYRGVSLDRTASHTVIVAEEFSRAVVILDRVGSAAVAENVEFVVKESAQLTVVSLQEWDNDAVHLSAQYASVARNAHFRHFVLTLGGDLVRVTPTVNYSGPGAEAELYGLYFADAKQHLEQRLFVDHNIEQCKSRVTYKGALQGSDAHTVWVGDVLIRAEATGTDTYELNRNLILTTGARADSVPNLEIKTGDIEGAGHASATGRFDEEQLFYLMARGISELEARRLVVRGFLVEVLQKLQIPDLQARLENTIDEELAQGNAA